MNSGDMSHSAIPPRLLTCNCQHCSGQIEFDAGGIKGNEIISLDCPHCQKETTATVLPTDAEIKQAEAELEKANAQKLINEKVAQVKDLLRKRLHANKSVFLYDSVFVPVDSVLDEKDLADDFDLTLIRKLGLLGWDIVQAVPKTIGIGLKNMNNTGLFGEEWGGGIGGNVVGVYIIIRKSITFSFEIRCDCKPMPKGRTQHF
jgi:thiol-disulfide isomerase/thioredoxin